VKEEFVLVLLSFALSKPSPGTSPLGLTSLKRKNLPIMVTLGGIGSRYASLAFNLIALFLATNCAITECKGKHIHPDPLIQAINNEGFFYLQQVSRLELLTSTTRWLGWQKIGLDATHAPSWRNYTNTLSSSLVNLTYQKDSLIWSFNLSRGYAPKHGYTALILKHIDDLAPGGGKLFGN
jgi:hypothetical protein